MQAEIDAQETTLAIQIVGVNGAGYESGNSGITTDRELPWLQPAAGDDVWTLWQVEYRDVVVLDPANERLFTFNLTANNLSDPDSFAALLSQLLEAAGTDAGRPTEP